MATNRMAGVTADSGPVEEIQTVETISDLIALIESLEAAEPPAPERKTSKLLIFGVACSAAGTLVLAAQLLL